MKSDQPISVDQEVVHPISFNRSKAKFQMEPSTVVTFDDEAGVDEAKQVFQEIVEFRKTLEKFTAVGARIPKGVLLVGPMGTGKTACQSHCRGGRGSLLLPLWF